MRYVTGQRWLGSLLVAAAVAMMFAGCGTQPADPPASPAQPPTVATAPAAEARAAVGAFSIVPPAGYVPDSAKAPQHALAYLGPQERDFTVNFNVARQRDDGAGSEAACRRAKQVMALLLKEYSPLEEGCASIDGHDAYWVSATFRWGGQVIRNLQFFLRDGRGVVFVVTFAAPVEAFAVHRPTFEHCVATARIVTTTAPSPDARP